MKLIDYNNLAYEFAIRNPRVIELLSMELNKEVVAELKSFGINAMSVQYHDGNEVSFCSLQELYLDYGHLLHINHTPYSPYGEGQWMDENTYEEHDNYRGDKILIHPLKDNPLSQKEDVEDAIRRIQSLIESRGKKRKRLMDGLAFENYDAITFLNRTPYSIDPSTNKRKTIESDISFIREWINPNKYLQLLPQYTSILE